MVSLGVGALLVAIIGSIWLMGNSFLDVIAASGSHRYATKRRRRAQINLPWLVTAAVIGSLFVFVCRVAPPFRARASAWSPIKRAAPLSNLSSRDIVLIRAVADTPSEIRDSDSSQRSPWRRPQRQWSEAGKANSPTGGTKTRESGRGLRS